MLVIRLVVAHFTPTPIAYHQPTVVLLVHQIHHVGWRCHRANLVMLVGIVLLAQSRV